MLEIVERWEKTNLLKGIQEELVASTAYMLENQRIYNENLETWPLSGCNVAQFKRISIPLVRRVLPQLKSHEKFKVESKPCLESCLVAPLQLRGPWNTSLEDRSPIWRQHDLVKEKEATAKFAETLRDAIDQLIENQSLIGPMNTFYVQCIGLDDNGEIVLYYDMD